MSHLTRSGVPRIERLYNRREGISGIVPSKPFPGPAGSILWLFIRSPTAFNGVGSVRVAGPSSRLAKHLAAQSASALPGWQGDSFALLLFSSVLLLAKLSSDLQVDCIIKPHDHLIARTWNLLNLVLCYLLI